VTPHEGVLEDHRNEVAVEVNVTSIFQTVTQALELESLPRAVLAKIRIEIRLWLEI
jgi:hypothetical protein